jgi:hypothetical protein
VTIAQTQREFKTFKKDPIPIVNNKLGVEYTTDPYSSMKIDYHDFKMQEEDSRSLTKGNWYLKYKKMFDFRCKEPFWGASPKYLKNNYLKSGYKFRLVDNQMIEDSIKFLLNKYLFNNDDTLKRWNLAIGNSEPSNKKIINRLGLEHFKFVITVFNAKKNAHLIEVPEAEQANDNMVYMEIIDYPADADIFLYNFRKENWEYVESVTVSGDHELELYVLWNFEPRYLKDCENTNITENENIR